MISLKPTKSKSSSKGFGKSDLEGHLVFQKTVSNSTRQEPKRISSISIVSKNTPSKQLHRQNKENYFEKEICGIPNNSDYIKSLYKKYLGKDSDNEKGDKTVRGTESQTTVRDTKDSSQLMNNCLTKLNSFRQSSSKPPMRSMSKREVITQSKTSKIQDSQFQQMLELCDKEDSCVKATLILKQARRRANVLFTY